MTENYLDLWSKRFLNKHEILPFQKNKQKKTKKKTKKKKHTLKVIFENECILFKTCITLQSYKCIVNYDEKQLIQNKNYLDTF